MTPNELAVLNRHTRLRADDIAWILFPMIGLASSGFLIDKLCPWPGYVMLYLMGSIGIVVSLGLLRSMWKFRGFSRAFRQDEVEVLEVQTTRAVCIPEEEPIYLMDMGGGKLLVLSDQWLWDSSLFTPAGSEKSFPADRFTIVRLRQTGMVVRIDVSGNPLTEVPAISFGESGLLDIPLRSFSDCMLIDLEWPLDKHSEQQELK